ncbi:MAG: FAD-dependent oxidoreductase [Burkholderiales bacterium]
MTSFDVTLSGREDVAEGTTAFHFSKPEGFQFKPGQAIDVILPDVTVSAASGNRHTFSLVSAPFEHELVVATRMRDSAFKRALKALPIGQAARIEGPFGSLILHNNRVRPALLIAGGIGITPFMSMLRQAGKDRLPQQLVLLYANRRPEDAAFLAELQELAASNEHFRLVGTMTQMARSIRSWDGETRALDENLLRSAGAGLVAPICYVAGPPAMVEAVRQALNRAGIDDDDIRSEEFHGY